MEQEDKLLMNGVEVELKNPGTKGLFDFLTIAKSMSKLPKDTDDVNIMEYLDDKALESVVRLINLTIQKTFPQVNEEIDAWAMENAMLILPKVIEMCSPKNLSHEASKKEELLNRLKQ